MRGIIGFIGMTAGGWLGGWLGGLVSVFTAFIVSMVGTGVWLYASRRLTSGLLP
jgi:hypothetical protein